MLRGSCLCSAVAYEVDGPVAHIGNCHCSICRKSHGTAFATWGIFDTRQFRWTAGESALRAYASSPGRQRLFCGTCDSSLASAHDGQVGEVVLASLDTEPGACPAKHIFVASKAAWHDITDASPQHPGCPRL